MGRVSKFVKKEGVKAEDVLIELIRGRIEMDFLDLLDETKGAKFHLVKVQEKGKSL